MNTSMKRKLDPWPGKEKMCIMSAFLGSFTPHQLPSVITPDQCPTGTMSNVSMASSSCTVSQKINEGEDLERKCFIDAPTVLSMQWQCNRGIKYTQVCFCHALDEAI